MAPWIRRTWEGGNKKHPKLAFPETKILKALTEAQSSGSQNDTLVNGEDKSLRLGLALSF